MQFIILGYDGSDSEAPQRRLAARGEHLKMAEEMYKEGKILYAAAILNNENQMIGSMILCDYPSREKMEEEWLKREPYLLSGVWVRTEILPAKTPPFIKAGIIRADSAM
jgi:uncharacterized protein